MASSPISGNTTLTNGTLTNGIGQSNGTFNIIGNQILAPQPPMFPRHPAADVQEITARLTRLKQRCSAVENQQGEQVCRNIRYCNVEDVIETCGDHNPIYNGVPDALAETLLQCAAYGRYGEQSVLVTTGLFYLIPQMYGKTFRIRTTYCGLALLDHWAKLYEPFSPFVDCYVNEEAREAIAADSFDLANGYMPGWIKNEMAEAEVERRLHETKVMKHLEEQRERSRIEAQMRAMQNMQLQRNLNELQNVYYPPGSAIGTGGIHSGLGTKTTSSTWQQRISGILKGK